MDPAPTFEELLNFDFTAIDSLTLPDPPANPPPQQQPEPPNPQEVFQLSSDSAYFSSPSLDDPFFRQHGFPDINQQQPLPAFSAEDLLGGFQEMTPQLGPQYLPAAPPTYDPAQYYPVQDTTVGLGPTQNPFSWGPAPGYDPAPYYPVQDMTAGLGPAPNLVAPAAPAPPAPSMPQPQPVAPWYPAPPAAPRQRRAPARNARPELSCGQCNYRNTNREEFRRHTESVHNNIRRHRCDICNVYINDPSGLSKHKKSAKHRARAQQLGRAAASTFLYECPACRANGKESRYSRPDHLKRHFKQNCDHTNGALPAGFHDGPGGMDRGRVAV